jgi:ankyrin repeat protein
MNRQARRARLAAALVLALLLPAAAAPPDSPVADAAMRRDIAAVRTLLKQRADVNAPQGDGMTALHWAAQHGDAELTKVLLRAKAGVNAVTRIGAYTPLHVASMSGSTPVVAALLSAKSAVNATTTTGLTPLHLAAMSGSAAVVQALLDRGAAIDATEPGWGQTPLMFAAAHDRVEAVRLLLARGANVSIAAKVVDLLALAAEDRAARQRRNQVLAAYRAEQAAGPAWNPTPAQVQAAARAALEVERNPAAAAAPAAAEAPPEGEREGRGGGGGDEDVAGFTAMVGFHGGLTALLLAVREGHIATVRALLDAGADVNQGIPADHTTPLLLAAINGHYDLAGFLLERGADPNRASAAGATPLYAVINKEWAPTSRTPQPTYHLQQKTSYLELIEALLKAGADPNVRLKRSLWYTTYNRDNLRVDFAGATPFWRAAYATDVPAMRLLLAHGADPSIPTLRRRRAGDTGGDDAGVWPIIAASGVGYGRGYAANDHRHAPDAWLPAVRLLVEELGADVNARDADGFTPLHYAAARGHNELILYLVSKGADVTAVARSGQTTADMANGPVQRISPYLDTVALLEKLGSKNNHRCVSC